jgi:hypothetical protein
MECWDWTDTVVNDGCDRLMGWAGMNGECPPLYTDSLRLHTFTYEVLISPHTPSQLVRIDTCWDDRNGSAMFGLVGGLDQLTPVIIPSYLSIGSVDVENQMPMPAGSVLSQNYPNPFNASTTISYSLPQAGPLELAIYNIAGQRVATLFEGTQEAGEHRVVWDARNAPSGVYFYRLVAGGECETKRMLLLK